MKVLCAGGATGGRKKNPEEVASDEPPSPVTHSAVDGVFKFIDKGSGLRCFLAGRSFLVFSVNDDGLLARFLKGPLLVGVKWGDIGESSDSLLSRDREPCALTLVHVTIIPQLGLVGEA